MFSKILVANRGEIAQRVFHTCRLHRIRTVAVYSDGDATSLHCAAADEAVHVGGTASRDSYLRIDRIIDAARATGAQAIHPGYGFLSERSAFAEACASAGIVLVGPPARAMDVMGDKVRARQAMVAAGVPVVPGVDDVSDVPAVQAAAALVGFPLLLKASAGGGGKGMRIVREAAGLERAFEGASREALAAFGDGRVFVERLVENSRHVEIQVMADAHGTCVYLGERDCSVQRRHQKVIEEAPCPSPQMTPEVRAAMGEVATRAARAVDYRGAGTVEFLFEETPAGPRFYFLEMNTRLQVEHPVTEAITSRDLVWDQIRVAAGEPLGYTQADIELRGHAVECRIYAEDPEKFLPSPGPLMRLRWPAGSHVRVDTGVQQGGEVSTHYDPMIAKLTVWGPTREDALDRMRRALEDTVVLGIRCNVAFHLRALDEPDFRAGRFDTRYIDRHPALVAPHEPGEGEGAAIAAAAAASVARDLSRRAGVSGPTAGLASPWRDATAWRRR
jgi:acetyl-CoA carboxylase biotin carboxylase subunit